MIDIITIQRALAAFDAAKRALEDPTANLIVKAEATKYAMNEIHTATKGGEEMAGELMELWEQAKMNDPIFQLKQDQNENHDS